MLFGSIPLDTFSESFDKRVRSQRHQRQARMGKPLGFYLGYCRYRDNPQVGHTYSKHGKVVQAKRAVSRFQLYAHVPESCCVNGNVTRNATNTLKST